jgi:hypothetical protein
MASMKCLVPNLTLLVLFGLGCVPGLPAVKDESYDQDGCSHVKADHYTGDAGLTSIGLLSTLPLCSFIW